MLGRKPQHLFLAKKNSASESETQKKAKSRNLTLQ